MFGRTGGVGLRRGQPDQQERFAGRVVDSDLDVADTQPGQFTAAQGARETDEQRERIPPPGGFGGPARFGQPAEQLVESVQQDRAFAFGFGPPGAADAAQGQPHDIRSSR